MIKILRELALNPREYSGRELSKLTGQTLATCQRNLEELVVSQIITFRKAPPSYLYSLNMDLVLNKKNLIPLFKNEAKTLSTVYDSIIKKCKPHCLAIIVFGSYARKEETDGSDLDVCFVVKAGHEDGLQAAVSNLQDTIYRDYRVTMSPHECSPQNFLKKRNRSPFKDIYKEGIWLHGMLMKIKRGVK